MIIANRLLKIKEDNNLTDVQINIFAPELDATSWICKYEINWPDNKRDSQGYGLDSVQALCLTLQKIGLDLYMSDYHATGRLVWDEPGQGYGFPVPKNGRDFLVGEDKHFEG